MSNKAILSNENITSHTNKLINTGKAILSDNKISRLELESGILTATWKADYIDLEIAKKVINNRINVTNGKSYPMLILIGSITDSTKDARDFLASEYACTGIIAGAICVKSSLENMLGNLFIYMNKPKVPTKLFRDETKAKKWLSKFIKEDQPSKTSATN